MIASTRRAAADPARRAAVDLLLAVERDGAYANLLLPRLMRERKLSSQDASFATEVGYGALRWQGVLDEVIAAAANRDVGVLDPAVRAVLRVGAYQLLHTRVPSHAAVATTVDMGKQVAGPRTSGLVNAVMRRVSERSWTQWVSRLAPADPLGRVAFEYGYPRWVAQAFFDALASDRAELELALAADRPVTHLAARPGVMDRDRLVELAGDGAVAGPYSPYAVRLAGGDPGRIGAVQDGRAQVQDEGSQLVALAATRARVDGPDLSWLDLCAGPGGKAALLAGLVADGGRLVAADVHPHRARLVRTAGGARTAVVVADGARPPWRPGSFDRVLLDAPCSGLGALRRRPEVRWRRKAEDLERLVELQSALLDSAIEAARIGGVIVYATCSPHPAETRAVVRGALARHGELDQLDARTLLADVPDLGAGPDVQLWPHRHGTDAMYIAALRKTNEPGSRGGAA
ncbi:MAG TPA: transcription antitermination factor NusB [Mycobacteriales bacterium]|nr:transcription antitermination factor NusB [Mycobacteriales bacterium]